MARCAPQLLPGAAQLPLIEEGVANPNATHQRVGGRRTSLVQPYLDQMGGGP